MCWDQVIDAETPAAPQGQPERRTRVAAIPEVGVVVDPPVATEPSPELLELIAA